MRFVSASVFNGLPEYSFPYYFGADYSTTIRQRIMTLEPDLIIIVADEFVWELHGKSLEELRSAISTIVIKVPRGEAAKRLEVLHGVISQAINAGATRQSVVVAFGGGATGNVGGLAAALLFRGIRLVHLPTTTIGAFDSVLSMKQAVNSDSGKNQIGTYFRPSMVMVDTCWFETLSPEVARGGWCEGVKNALAILPATLDTLVDLVTEVDSYQRWAELFDMSLTAKMTVMAEDPYERHCGLTLEYGHTIGHAIEYAAVESTLLIPHGDAISLGMIAAARISQAEGHLDAAAVQVHEDIIARLGAPTQLPRDLNLERVLTIVRSDNKRGLISCHDDEIAMVLLSDLGKPILEECMGLPLSRVPIRLIKTALMDLVGGYQ